MEKYAADNPQKNPIQNPVQNPIENPRCVALLIAAPASGQGKTTVTAAIARHWTARGLRVRIAKCGPDFLDPQWLACASGAAVENLDLWIMGAPAVRHRVRQLAAQADLLLIEGVMGLFDGAPHSAAEMARLLGVPIVAVVEAAALSATFGALEWGLRTYMPELPWAGVLANRSAHAAHTALLRQSLKPDATWLGAMPPLRLDAQATGNLLPHRHLGLVSADEMGDASARLDTAAAAWAATDMGRWDWAEWQRRWTVEFAPNETSTEAPHAPPQQASHQLPPLLAGRTIAIARDAAFSFIYPANLECLERLGARLRFFSPLAGDALPACDALWLPGGYPELHAPTLAAHTHLAAQLHAHHAAGRPIWAEGGGMMAIAHSLTLADASTHPMWALLPLRVRMLTKLGGLGKRHWRTHAGDLRGHTFHYSRAESVNPLADDTQPPIWAHAQRPAPCEPAPNHAAPSPHMPQGLLRPTSSKVDLGRGQPSTSPSSATVHADGEAIYAVCSTRGSYFHPWFYSAPQMVAALFGADVGIF